MCSKQGGKPYVGKLNLRFFEEFILNVTLRKEAILLMSYYATDRLSIFIDSYDGNSDIWQSFFNIFDFFWKDCPYQRYLVTNEKDCSEKNLTVIKTGREIDWFTTTLTALYKVKTKYVWLFLDDYFLSKKIDNSDIEEVIDYMENNNVFFYRLSLCGSLDKKITRRQITNDFYYAINLQPAVWEKEKFIYFLEKLQKEGCRTPWDFERYFIDYFKRQNKGKTIEGVVYDNRDIMGYQNAIIQGKWVRRVLAYYKRKFGIIIHVNSREIMPFYAEVFDFIKGKAPLLFSCSQRIRIKALLEKIGFKFMSH